MNNSLKTNRRSQQGITLVESLITLAVSTIVLGAAVPSFEAARERRQIEGTAAQIETDLQHARSLAVAQGVTVRMSFNNDHHGACHVVHTGSQGDCSCTPATGSAVCSAGAQVLQTSRWAAASGVQIDPNVRSIGFDAARGTVTPTATIRVRAKGVAIHQVVNVMGRVRSCSPAPTLPGYRAC